MEASELLFAESKNLWFVRPVRKYVLLCEWPRSNLLLLRVNSVFWRVKCLESWTRQSPNGASCAEASFVALWANICVFRFLQTLNIGGLCYQTGELRSVTFNKLFFQVDCMENLFWLFLLIYRKIRWQRPEISIFAYRLTILIIENTPENRIIRLVITSGRFSLMECFMTRGQHRKFKMYFCNNLDYFWVFLESLWCDHLLFAHR